MAHEASRPIVLITGASGLLGMWLRRTAPEPFEVVSVVHRTPVDGPSVAVDLRDPDAVDRAFAEVQPSLVIHGAMTVDEPSIVGATRHVAEAAARQGADLVFISTDAVFSGDGELRDEDAPPDPIWDYGRWKAEAETIARDACPTAPIIRLPLVVTLDPEDKAVERTRLAAEAGERIAWFDDELRQPAMASDLAPAIWRIASLPPERGAGAWHLMGPERMSRFAIAQRIVVALGLDPAAVVGEPTKPGLVRPRDLHLGSGRARAEIGWDPVPILGT